MFIVEILDNKDDERARLVEKIKGLAILTLSCTKEEDENNLTFYKRIFYVMNIVLRLNTINTKEYYSLYKLFKEQHYNSPYNKDGSSYRLLECLSMIACCCSTNSLDNERIADSFCKEINNTIHDEIKIILEL